MCEDTFPQLLNVNNKPGRGGRESAMNSDSAFLLTAATPASTSGDVIPPVEVAAGVWQIVVGLPFRPRTVHACLIEASPGSWMLVDGGVNSEQAWNTVDAAVNQLAGGWRAIAIHFVTHMHIDHFGLAGRVAAASDAVLLMSRLDAERAAHAQSNPAEEQEFRAELLARHGAPPTVWGAPEESSSVKPNPWLAYAAPDQVLDGERGPLPGAPAWEYHWTPGHTAGHLVLFRREGRLLVGGDAVLQNISPNIGVNRQRTDPVGDYLDALGRLVQLEPALIVPGHGPLITEPAARIGELRAETQRESERVLALLESAAATAWEIAAARYAGRDLPAHARVQALRETLAHLDHLQASGRAVREMVQQVVRWSRRY